jgi:hypothetical protein
VANKVSLGLIYFRAHQQQALYYSLSVLISGLQFSPGTSRYPESEAEQKRSDVIMMTGVTTKRKEICPQTE